MRGVSVGVKRGWRRRWRRRRGLARGAARRRRAHALTVGRRVVVVPVELIAAAIRRRERCRAHVHYL